MSKPREIMAVISTGYASKIMLPLEEAHKIQAILARHAVKYETVWCNPQSIHYLCDYDTPEVVVVARPPDFDARGLTPTQVRDWSQMLSTLSEDGTPTEIMDPHTFVKLRSDADE